MAHASLPDSVFLGYGWRPGPTAAGGGTAGRTWLVETGEERCFVRQRGLRTSTEQRVRFDHGFRAHLRERGFPTAAPLTTLAGKTWIEHEAGWFEAYPYVEGRPYSLSLPARVRETAARALAELHRLGADYPGQCEELVPQFGSYPVPISMRPWFDAAEAQLEAMDYAARTWATPETVKLFDRALERIRATGDAYDPSREALPRCAIHGDYNCFNLLFWDDGDVAGVFDFDWAWKEVRLMDIATGVFFFGTSRAGALDSSSIWSLTDCPVFSVETTAAFVGAYEACTPLSKEEREALPDAILSRWISWRLEGAVKVPPDRRAEFVLHRFFEPFDWWDRNRLEFLSTLLR